MLAQYYISIRVYVLRRIFTEPKKPIFMQAIEITRYGAPDVLSLCERPMPTCAAGEVLIRVHASGINRPDVLQRTGSYPVPPGASDLPGLEVAGVIEATAPDVTQWKIGDSVCALVAGGGYAELCVAPAGQCLPVPKGLTMIEAAGLPETFFTVWHNVFQRGALKAGETLLIQGGTSGIGTTAIALGKAFGAKVIATAGSDEKCAACISLGADLAVNYKTQDFVQAAKDFTGNKGVDVILDMVAGDYVAREVECLAEDGRLVIIAVQGGIDAKFNAGMVLRKRLTITGSTLRPRSVAFKTALANELRAQVWPLLEKGQCKPQVFKVFKPSQAAEAHTLMESNQHIGKLIIDWQTQPVK
jgi:NADPH:quinone reductase